jgi:hypothetical protein
MWKFAAPLCFAVLTSFALATPGLAFGDGCGDGAVACYDKVRLPDVYAVRTRPAVVSPGWREVVPSPALYARSTVPVEVRPGRWRTRVHAPVYATRLERVVVAPAGHTYEDVPAVTRRVARTVVSPGGVTWVRRRGLFGRERLCKVVRAPVTRTVVRDVIVSPARRIAHRTPAVYATVARPVLVRPAVAERVYEPPVHALYSRPVVVRPAGVQLIDHPPVVGVARESVLVRSGGYAWKRSRPGLFDRW